MYVPKEEIVVLSGDFSRGSKFVGDLSRAWIWQPGCPI